MTEPAVGTGAEREETPPDGFRRASVLLGVLALDLSSLVWLFGGGGSILFPTATPGTQLGTSKTVVPLVVGLASILIVMYRRQVDLRAGYRSYWLFLFALFGAVTTAGAGGVLIALNLGWIFSMI